MPPKGGSLLRSCTFSTLFLTFPSYLLLCLKFCLKISKYDKNTLLPSSHVLLTFQEEKKSFKNIYFYCGMSAYKIGKWLPGFEGQKAHWMHQLVDPNFAGYTFPSQTKNKTVTCIWLTNITRAHDLPRSGHFKRSAAFSNGEKSNLLVWGTIVSFHLELLQLQSVSQVIFLSKWEEREIMKEEKKKVGKKSQYKISWSRQQQYGARSLLIVG